MNDEHTIKNLQHWYGKLLEQNDEIKRENHELKEKLENLRELAELNAQEVIRIFKEE